MHVCAVHKSQAGIILTTLLYSPLISYQAQGPVFNVYQANWWYSGSADLLVHLIVVYIGYKPGIVGTTGQKDNILMFPAIRSLAVSLTEINEHLAIALPHVLRHSKDTGYIVVEEWILLLKSRTNRWAGHTSFKLKVSAVPQIQNKAACKVSG